MLAQDRLRTDNTCLHQNKDDNHKKTVVFDKCQPADTKLINQSWVYDETVYISIVQRVIIRCRLGEET